MDKDIFLYLQILLNFLIAQTKKYQKEIRIPLGVILGDMSINTWSDHKPADLAVWHDWSISTKECLKNNSPIDLCIKKEQAFIAAFNFLNEFYWFNNNDIILGDIIQEIEKCLNDIEKNKLNPLLPIWCKYLEAEKDNKYTFD